MTAKDIMTRGVVTIHQNATIEELIDLIIEKKLHGVPVVNENGQLAGIITENDLIAEYRSIEPSYLFGWLMEVFVPLEKEQERFVKGGNLTKEDFKKLLQTPVKDKMITDLTTIKENTSVEEICAIMYNRKIHLLPVMDEEKMVGVVGKFDLMKAIAAAMKG